MMIVILWLNSLPIPHQSIQIHANFTQITHRMNPKLKALAQGKKSSNPPPFLSIMMPKESRSQEDSIKGGQEGEIRGTLGDLKDYFIKSFSIFFLLLALFYLNLLIRENLRHFFVCLCIHVKKRRH